VLILRFYLECIAFQCLFYVFAFLLDSLDIQLNNFAIQYASEHGHLEVVKLLLSDKRVDPAAKDNFAIRLASGKGHLEVVKLLSSDKRVDPAAKDNFAIGYASENGHLEVVKLLLFDERVDPAAKDNFAVKQASRYYRLETVSLLLSSARVCEQVLFENDQQLIALMDPLQLFDASSWRASWPPAQPVTVERKASPQGASFTRRWTPEVYLSAVAEPLAAGMTQRRRSPSQRTLSSRWSWTTLSVSRILDSALPSPSLPWACLCFASKCVEV